MVRKKEREKNLPNINVISEEFYQVILLYSRTAMPNFAIIEISTVC